jgi:hypothetical protein
MLSNKAVDKMTDHRIDMLLLAIVVSYSLYSLSASSVVSYDQTTIFSSIFFATSSGKTGKMPSP